MTPVLVLAQTDTQSRDGEFEIAGTPAVTEVHMIGGMLLGMTHKTINGLEQVLPIEGVVQVRAADDDDNVSMLRVETLTGDDELRASFRTHVIHVHQYTAELPAVSGDCSSDGPE